MALLRRQVFALLQLRFRLWRNRLRSLQGIFDTLAGALMILGGLILSILLAGLVALFYYLMNTEGTLSRGTTFGILLGLIGGLGLILPLIFGEARLELSPGSLLNFPLNLKNLFLLQFGLAFLSGANLILYPSFLSIFVSGIITSTTRLPASFAALLLFLICLLAWQQAFLSIFRNLMQSRRIREISVTLGLIFLFGLSLLPSLLNSTGASLPAAQAAPGPSWHPEGLIALLATLARLLPPALVAEMISADKTGIALLSGLGLIVWGVGGLLLTWFSFRRILMGKGQGAGKGQSEGRSAVKAGRMPDLLAFLPGEISAVTRKHLKYFFRSTSGRSLLPVALLLALVISILAQRSQATPFLRLFHEGRGFLFLCFFAGEFSSKFTSNIFIWDGPAVESYFTSPNPQWKILLGHNVGAWILNTLILMISLLVWVAVHRGLPEMTALLSGSMLWIGGALLSTTTGNFLSILFPQPREISKMNNKPSRGASIASAVLFAPTHALIVGPIFLILFGYPEIGFPLMLIVLILLAMSYRLLLPRAGNLMLQRREKLIGTFAGRRDSAE